MSLNSKLNISTETVPLRWVLTSLMLVTLYFQTNLADPFNSPKQWVLTIVAAWLLGYIFQFRAAIRSVKQIKYTYYLLILFLITNTIAFIFTDNKFVAFFGDTQRRNGFLTYLALAVILLASAVFFRITNVQKLFYLTFIIGIIQGTYGLLQTSGNDFIQWNNPYNPIITTLGNPNFAAATMAIIATIVFSLTLNSQFKRSQRVLGVILTLILIVVIYKSNARQGLVSFLLGVGTFLTIFLITKNKKLGFSFLFFGFVFFLLMVLGMLQIGPLEKFLYKPSVSIRGYYWRAAIEMFKDNPIVGIGIDRYGAYFRQFRDVGYPLTYGWDITSSNAHNTFLQFFATGGVLVGLSYILLMLHTLKCAVFSIKRLEGSNRLLVSGVFAAWIAFQAQSLVSIDNIGISIWNWILSGAIIGISASISDDSNVKKVSQSKSKHLNPQRALVSGLATMIIVPIIFTQYRGENNTYKTLIGYNMQDPMQNNLYKEANLLSINSLLIDPSYALNSANNLISADYTSEGLKAIENIYQKDRRNLNALKALVFVSEKSGNLDAVAKYRKLILSLDPWDAPNILELAKVYKAKSDTELSQTLFKKIIAFAPNTPEANQAELELQSQD
jgi:O-antigen ligase